MTFQSTPLVQGKEFVMGYRQQNVWKQWIALAFFFGKIGSGMFILSLFFGTPLVALAGIIIENVGKGGALLVHLGRPERFWRALSRPSTSWIARTVWAMGIFTVVAVVYLLIDQFMPSASALLLVLKVISLLLAVVVAISDGFVMNDSSAIPIWNTPIIPFLFLLYTLLGGTSVFIFLLRLGWVTIPPAGIIAPLSDLGALETTLLLTNLAGVVIYLLSVINTTGAARESLWLLIKGPYAKMFFSFVVIVGFLVTLVLTLFAESQGSIALVGLLMLADLIGHFFVFYLLLQVGVYSPVMGKLTI